MTFYLYDRHMYVNEKKRFLLVYMSSTEELPLTIWPPELDISLHSISTWVFDLEFHYTSLLQILYFIFYTLLDMKASETTDFNYLVWILLAIIVYFNHRSNVFIFIFFLMLMHQLHHDQIPSWIANHVTTFVLSFGSVYTWLRVTLLAPCLAMLGLVQHYVDICG